MGGWREGGDLGVSLGDFNSEVRERSSLILFMAKYTTLLLLINVNHKLYYFSLETVTSNAKTLCPV